MRTGQKRYEDNRELMKDYVNDHPELKVFVKAFEKMQQANDDNKIVKFTIRVGKAGRDMFCSYLTSNVKNPRVLYSSWRENGKLIPQIIISDDTNTIACFDMDSVHIVCKIEEDNLRYPFKRYNFTIRIDDKFDYRMTIIIEN